jgi:dipeptidyl aminopeptidase/acylaminoacyl peptidase
MKKAGVSKQTTSSASARIEWHASRGPTGTAITSCTGWSHLYLAEQNGEVRALTSGEWELRGAQPRRDRRTWLLRTREHPPDDHLYTMPTAGGALERLTTEQGRGDGVLSPDGRRVAVVYSRSDRLPDLYPHDPVRNARRARITASGADELCRHA